MIVVAAVVMTSALQAHAADIQPTQAQIDACRSDAMRFCKTEAMFALFTGNRAPVRQCMVEHKAQLSQACRDAFK